MKFFEQSRSQSFWVMVTLAEELPFAVAARNEYLSMVCSACFATKEDRPISRCIGCQVVHYCNKDCQKKDWVNHKRECSFLAKNGSDIPNTTCRLIARVAHKLRRGDEANQPAFNGRVYEELMDHKEEFMNDPEEAANIPTYMPILQRYMGEKYAPNKDLLLSIYGKVNINGFNIGTGIALYLGVSVHNHSCVPDAFVSFDGAKVVLRSPDENQKYSKDLTISYVDLLKSNADRKAKLRSLFFFECTCKLCSDPTMDFLYNSAYSTCCPDSYCLLDPDGKELTCFNCGTVSSITVKKAVDANILIGLHGSMIEKLQSNLDNAPYYLQDITACYEKFSKILSPFNLNLLMINDRLFHEALISHNIEVGQKYGPLLLPAYRRFLSVGDKLLSERLMQIAMMMSQGAKPNKKMQEYYEEAYTASIVAHGPTHSQTTTVDRLASGLRTCLQRDKSK